VGRIDFVEGGIIPEKLSSDKYALLLILYCGGLFTSLLLPFYLFYRSINIEPIIVYVLFFLAYGLSSLYIFIKLLAFVFGFSGFATVILQLGYGDFFNCVEWIFLVNITVASVFLVFSKSLKSSFFYLFFQQFLCTLFAIFIFAVFDESLILLTLLSFLLSFSLVFLSISNCILYLKKSQQKWLSGLFYNLKISVILFVFAIGNLMGIIPGIGAVEKFFLIKIIMQKELWLTAIVFGINFFSLIIFSWKIFYPIFFQLDESEVKSNLGDEIDYDSSLILTPLILVVAIVFGLIFFPILTKFL
jgi:formate hydrogenlyase subunit 3/multisubunit Na+/H+ antiporter MnhD subunit